MTHGDPARGGRHGDAGLAIGRQGIKPITLFIELARARKAPFFLWYAPMMPHQPHNPPERLLAHYRGKAPDRGGRQVLGDVRVVRRDLRRAARLPR